MICTDLASRGIDYQNVEHVINFDFPVSTVDYVHRVGRTGRMGKSGTVTSLLQKKDKDIAEMIETYLKKQLPLEGLSRDMRINSQVKKSMGYARDDKKKRSNETYGLGNRAAYYRKMTGKSTSENPYGRDEKRREESTNPAESSSGASSMHKRPSASIGLSRLQKRSSSYSSRGRISQRSRSSA